MFIAIEAGLVVLVLVLAFTVPNLGSHWFEAIEKSFGKLAHRRGLSVITVGLSALALRAALLPILPIPAPGIPDEYCYLLLSDTFAHGRLTNPTNPMWVHFESPFILWHPTYTAKYWPAQGLFMAVGQVLMGHPFWGVWLSVGLMCAAITWMLQAWVGEGWALLGGFLAVIRFGTFNYWADSYWGGAVAAIGGALVLGALPRMKQHRKVRYALLMGLGFAILANSRPYEGLLFSIPVAVAMLAWLWKMKRRDLSRTVKRIMAPLLAVLALTLIVMGYYFWRTTGNPFSPPYVVYKARYNPVPNFPWQRMMPYPAYRHPEFRPYFQHMQKSFYDTSREPVALAFKTAAKLVLFWNFYLGPVFTLPVLLAIGALPFGFSWKSISAQTRILLGTSGAVLLASMLSITYQDHYSAPATCSVLALVLIAMRYIRSQKWGGKPAGRFVTRAVPAIFILLFALRAAAGPLHVVDVPSWCARTPSNTERAAIRRRLSRLPGRQLVIVHYNPKDYGKGFQWVYNKADIDSAKVIWADDMGPQKNQQLIHYFKHRHAWMLYVDHHPPKLIPYSEAAAGHPLTAGEDRR